MAKRTHTTTSAMQSAAKRGLQMIKDGKVEEGHVHDISLKSGRKIASGQQISDDHVRSMAAYHAAHAAPFFNGPRLDVDGGQSVLLGCPVGEGSDAAEHCDDLMWGGPAGASWSASRVAAMDASALAECDVPDISTLLDGDGFSIEVFSRGDLLGRTELQKDADGLIWAPIIRSGTLAMRPNPDAPGGKEATPLVFVPGYSSDPNKEIGLQDLVQAFEEKAVEHVTIPKTHGNGTLDNTGTIVKMKIADSTIRPGEKVILAGHKFTEPDVEGKVERGSVLSRSCGILHRYTNQETGKVFPHVIEHVALTNKPWVTGMEPYGSSTFSENRQVVPMLLSESVVITPPANDPQPRKPVFSTSDPIESLGAELNLADIQWGDEPSLMDIKHQLYEQLRRMWRSDDGDYDDGGCYCSVMDITPTKALVQMDYGDPDGDNDAWVIPYAVDDQGILRLGDFADWKVVEQKWVTDEDADTDKQEVQQILQEATNMSNPVEYLESNLLLSESDLNLATLTAKARKALPPTAFVFPPSGEQPGRYPVHDEAHARAALSRVAQHGTPDEQAKVKAAVKKRYPNIDADGGGKTGKTNTTNTSLPADPLKRASYLRLSQEPTNHQQGGVMGLTPDLLERLNLDDTAREVLQREIEQDQRDAQELKTLRAERKQNSVKERLTKLSEAGFKDCPGFLREVEQILLSDDGDVAIRLNLSEEQRTVNLTATEIVDRLLAALPMDGGKVDLSSKGNLLESPLSGRPNLKPEGKNEGEEDKPLTGEQLLEQWKEALGAERLELELAPVGGGKEQ